MLKHAIVLYAVLFATAADFSCLSNSVEKVRLTALNNVESIIKSFQQQLESLKEDNERLVKQGFDKSVVVISGIWDDIATAMMDTITVINETKISMDKDFDISKCMKLPDSIMKKAEAVASSLGACVLEQVNLSSASISREIHLVKNDLSEFEKIMEDINQCSKHDCSIKSITNAVTCIHTAEATAIWNSIKIPTELKRIPNPGRSIIIDGCMATKEYTNFYNNLYSIFFNTGNCMENLENSQGNDF